MVQCGVRSGCSMDGLKTPSWGTVWVVGRATWSWKKDDVISVQCAQGHSTEMRRHRFFTSYNPETNWFVLRGRDRKSSADCWGASWNHRFSYNPIGLYQCGIVETKTHSFTFEAWWETRSLSYQLKAKSSDAPLEIIKVKICAGTQNFTLHVFIYHLLGDKMFLGSSNSDSWVLYLNQQQQ